MADCCPVCGEPEVRDDQEGYHEYRSYPHPAPPEINCDTCNYWMPEGEEREPKETIEDLQDELIDTIQKWQKIGSMVIERITKKRKHDFLAKIGGE